MESLPIAAAVFVLVLAIIFGGYWMAVVRPETGEQQSIRKRLRQPRKHRFLAKKLEKERERLSAVGGVDAVLVRLDALSNPLQRLIAQSGLQITVGTLVLASIFLALAVATVMMFMFPYRSAALAAGAAVSTVPYLYLKRTARKRLEKFEEQFPEAIDLIARALRAGHALPTSLQMVADEIPQPVGEEFKLLFEQHSYGMSLPEALGAFGDRVPLLDARFFVTAVMTQREMGGNLSEVLDKLSAVIRERFKVKRQVRVISAHGRITGMVLGFLPPAVAGILMVISPKHMGLLFNDPLGLYMVAGAIFLQVVGVLAIRKIVDVEY